ncbi:MAG: 2-succinyl-5-enolpyruvyl-6-hydroxy-3-cyclohexene-1-carboxylic-acid synthase [Propionibacteriales bacterium]|nr:2-succinyl-5-enolpyruvyl-6-hydroxy-3-cyclohexene-1-carboxylic-acid synthase [Propionibacteriales bacterium]
MSSAHLVAMATVNALRRTGVSDVVLAPGSRSAALAVVLHEANAVGVLRLHVRIDERTAGFLALGLAKGSHRPVAVVTTSGTAVANLHPAVLEAFHSGERLIVVSADRPAEMRGTGANQTTELQAAMFGRAARSYDVAAGDAVAATDAIEQAVRHRGPTHVNLQFADPLLPQSLPLGVDGNRPDQEPDGRPDDPVERHTADGEGLRLGLGPRTVVVAGDDAGPSARLLAQDGNWPLLAEPTSGARTGRHALRTYRLLLGSELGAQIERVVVAGHPTLSRPVARLISRSDIEVISVRSRSGICTDPGRVARHVDVVPVAAGHDGSDWIDAWRAADARVSAQLDALVADDSDAFPLLVAAEVARAVPAGGLLVVGSSQPIRDLDVMARPYPVGQRRLVLGNRGLSGIDGTVSTAVGAALGRRSSRALAYVGDITFLHDMTGLVLGPPEPRPDLTVVVANDDGGSIFATLEQGGDPYAAAFERVFATPHGVDLEELCRATRTAYEQASTGKDLRRALDAEQAGMRVVEVPIPRRGRRVLAERLLRIV